MDSLQQNPEPAPAIVRFLRRTAWRKALPYLVAGSLLLIAVIAVGGEIERHFAALEAWLAGLGQWGLAAFIVLFVLAASCLVPDSLLCLLAGALFDLRSGIAAAIGGMLLASVLQYALARRLLRPHVERMLAQRPSLDAIQRAVRRDEFRLQCLLRLTPLNPATASYLFGAVGVRFRGFVIACLMLIPALVIEVYAGHAGRHITRLAAGTGSTSHLHELLTLAGLAVSVLVFAIISKLARNAVSNAVAHTEPADNPPQ